MTTAEFKKAYPEHAHLEGDALWDMMTEKALVTQEGDKILLHAEPFWRRYRLRWLYYPKGRGWDGGYGPKYTHSQRCNKCKVGVGAYFGMMSRNGFEPHCPKCGPGLVLEPSKNLDHRLWSVLQEVCRWAFIVLNFLHIRRHGSPSRYDAMGGDEAQFVTMYEVLQNPWRVITHLRPRRWWEYVIIKR